MIPNILVKEIFKTKSDMECHFNTCIFSVFNCAPKGMKVVLRGKNISPFIHKTDTYMQYMNKYL